MDADVANFESGVREFKNGAASTISGSVPPAGAANNSILASFYTRMYPNADDLALEMEDVDEDTLEEVVTELRNEVNALKEETGVLVCEVELLKARRAGGGVGGAAVVADGSGGPGGGNAGAPGARSWEEFGSTGGSSNGVNAVGNANEVANANLNASLGSSTSNPLDASRGGRGQRYQRKSQTELDQYVTVEDKMTLLVKEMERTKLQEERAGREAANVTELLTATVEESLRRMKELRLEVRHFYRDVIGAEDDDEDVEARRRRQQNLQSAEGHGDYGRDDGPLPPRASADELLRYMERRLTTQGNYLDKLKGQCQAAEQDILRAQQELRQRRAAGEAFHAIDFEQLRIENQQFNERIDKKNAELADLKGTSTRTVQTLNTLMDVLNEMLSEQAQLKKESKTRSEYLTRCSKEVVVVEKGAVEAEKKNTAIKAHHEAVKVPKIEEYIAQKAELFELERAMNNWNRKVEIAEGQVAVMKQQTRKLTKQRDQALEYSRSKKRCAVGGGAMKSSLPTGAAAAAVVRLDTIGVPAPAASSLDGSSGPATTGGAIRGGSSGSSAVAAGKVKGRGPSISSGSGKKSMKPASTTLSPEMASGNKETVLSPASTNTGGPPHVGPETPAYTAVNSARSLLDMKRSGEAAAAAALDDGGAIEEEGRGGGESNTAAVVEPAEMAAAAVAVPDSTEGAEVTTPAVELDVVASGERGEEQPSPDAAGDDATEVSPSAE